MQEKKDGKSHHHPPVQERSAGAPPSRHTERAQQSREEKKSEEEKEQREEERDGSANMYNSKQRKKIPFPLFPLFLLAYFPVFILFHFPDLITSVHDFTVLHCEETERAGKNLMDDGGRTGRELSDEGRG